MFFNRVLLSAIVAVVFLLLNGCKDKTTGHEQPVPADEAINTFSIADDFKIELIAAEPLVTDPVDMEIDEFGRMYVVEMHGYPLDKSGSGKIIVLADSDDDGVMDKRTVFKEGLILPTGILRWKNGLLVTDAPYLLYLEDKDNNGVAENTDTVLSGFALTNPQHNTNNPVYGIDNWIYIAHEGAVGTREYEEEFGDEGKEIVFHDAANAPRLPKNANGRSVRFRPDQLMLEMNASRCQFGHSFNNFGHHFQCNNSNQGYHEVMAAKYFSRNPDLVIADAIQNMSDHGNAAEVFATTINPERQILTDAGVLTSACGLIYYNGGLFPAPYNNGVTFVAEPVSNLVHADIIKDSGASFIASRLFKDKEFLSSSDSWSRPVNFYIGPDGALYVLDYYRRLIESPEWMADEVVAAGGLYDGSDKGRIYRITPTGTRKLEWMKGLSLGKADNTELLKQLSNDNYWWRINAQRLLVDRKDSATITLLENMVQTAASDFARLHALFVLDGMNALTPAILNKCVEDSNAGIRENSVRLSERFIADAPSLVQKLLSLETDPNVKVRFQLLLTLGDLTGDKVQALRHRMLLADINNEWMQSAALSALNFRTAEVLKTTLKQYNGSSRGFESLLKKLSTMTGANAVDGELNHLVFTSLQNTGKEWFKPLLEGITQGIQRRKVPFVLKKDLTRDLLNEFFKNRSSSALNLLKTSANKNDISHADLQRAIKMFSDKSVKVDQRALAVEMLLLSDNPGQYASEYKQLIVPQEPIPVQLAAIRTWSASPGTEISTYLLQNWKLFTPEIRDAGVAAILADSARVALLIDAIEKGLVPAEDISFGRSVGLMQNKNRDLRNRARQIFTKNQRERKKVQEEYKLALSLKGNISNGKNIYQQQCAICHQVRGQTGIDIGPDLGSVHNWIKEDLLANIIDPGLSIASEYDLWEIVTNSGENIQGIIASESPVAVTVRNINKPDRTVNRQEIKSISAMFSSLMPAGLEKNINQQQMADLIAFLRGAE